MLNQDFREFIELLNVREVKYLVIGGYAVALHGHPRYTKDIDFVVSIDSDDPIEYGKNYFDLTFELERIFKRKIDLLEQKAVSNKLFMDLIDQKKMLVYARRN